jgi:hypothetical protein
MTGIVEWPVLLWIIGVVCGAFVAGAVGVWRVATWSANELAKRDLAIDTMGKQLALADQTIDARAKLAEEGLSRAMAAQQLHAAEHFVTKDGLADALHGVQTSIDRLSDLLNQLLVQAAGNPPLQPNPPRRTSRGAS